MTQPFFSIIIPLYNKEKYIKRAINSVLNQSFHNFEIIVINDGSTDNSLSVAKSIKDPRIKVYSKKHHGVSYARNSGIQNAKGQFIAFLDADDEYLPIFLMTVLTLIKKYKNIKFVATAFKTIYDYGIETITSYGLDDKDYLIDNFIMQMAKQTGFYIHISSIAIDRKLLIQTGLFYCSTNSGSINVMGEDFDLWIRLSEIYSKIAYSNKLCSIYYRNTENNTTKGFIKNDIDFSFCEKSLKKKIANLKNEQDKIILMNLLYKFYSTIVIQLLIRNNFEKAKIIFNKLPKNKQYINILKIFKLYTKVHLLMKKSKSNQNKP